MSAAISTTGTLGAFVRRGGGVLSPKGTFTSLGEDVFKSVLLYTAKTKSCCSVNGAYCKYSYCKLPQYVFDSSLGLV
jgi:hypothetical protein